MRGGRIMWACAAVVGVLAGCATDLGVQVTTNATARTQVMGAYAGNGGLAEEMTRHLLATDSLRARVIETVLRDAPSSQYVLERIGRNREALDYVLQVAASDSSSREHLLTLLRGMQIALKAGAK